MGQEITYNFDNTHSYLEGMKFYADFHTNELYLITAVQNSYLRPWNYVGLALGIKFQIRRM